MERFSARSAESVSTVSVCGVPQCRERRISVDSVGNALGIESALNALGAERLSA